MHNHYLDVLELHEGASKAEIKSAYRRLSKRYHPDLNKSEDAQEKFVELNEAYKFLMDVGPRPQTIQQSEPDYGYDPEAEAYRQWREKARAYARQQTRDAIRRQNELIKYLLRFFNYATFVMLSFNILLEVDRHLPMEKESLFVKEIVTFRGRQKLPYQYFKFEDFEMKFQHGKVKSLDINRPVQVYFTPIFSMPIAMEYMSTKRHLFTVHHRMTLVGFFSFLIKMVFLCALLYFIVRNLDTQLSLAILLIFVYLFELVLFF